MSRARAAGWASNAEDALWEQSEINSRTAFESLPDEPLVRALPTRREPGTFDEPDTFDEPGTFGEPAEVLPLPSSAAKPLQQYVTAFVQRIFLTPERTDDVVRSAVFAALDTAQGSELVSAASAEVLASSVVGRVCLVDANFGAPSLHRLYGVANEGGLAQLLTGKGHVRDFARRLSQGPQSSLWLVPAGPLPAGDPSALTGELSPGRLHELMKAFDFVLFEAPSVREHPTASILGGFVDGVVLVAEANMTRRHTARAAVESLRASGARVLGAVLNNRTFPIPALVYKRL
jgi:Mrp family chromosome partitioning ATPase